MKTSFFNKSVMGILVLVALSLSACAKKESSATRVAGRSNTPAVTQPNAVNSCGNASMNVGKIYDYYNSGSFESQVKSFISATLDPQTLGTISGNINDKTGIDFFGAFKFDSSGNLVAGSSTVLIKIFDSYAGQSYNGQVIQPYQVEFSAAASGTINRNTRQFTVKFSDSYGDIVFQGQYDGTLAQGNVTYQNRTAVNGYSPASGTLGQFKAYTCALIQ
ncbi:hypothetical protein AZI87_12650 [Bdellovibrio bacteriovorus]|uniref:Lipoprotein n=1 Tax=Bdellovibrio bacteriovorus TaxID=959 RepID=A0A162G9W7_BDEBC|nr:hypothetical protein [Bdellovibrio bacteriovorus]KYG65391.1 hypothetical protein AZI87_12650 [Bdellovibrio bacteriovorus]